MLVNTGLLTDFLTIIKVFAAMWVNVNADTLFFTSDSKLSFMLLDSIAQYHYIKKGSILTGIVIGAFSGALIGGVIGHLSANNQPNSNHFTGIISYPDAVAGELPGALIGCAIGIVGGAIVGSSKRDVFKNFTNESKDKKKEYFYNKIH